MKMKIERAPDSAWFGTWKGTLRTRDLGDLVIWILGWELTIWWSKPPPQDHWKKF